MRQPCDRSKRSLRVGQRAYFGRSKMTLLKVFMIFMSFSDLSVAMMLLITFNLVSLFYWEHLMPTVIS